MGKNLSSTPAVVNFINNDCFIYVCTVHCNMLRTPVQCMLILPFFETCSPSQTICTVRLERIGLCKAEPEFVNL
jgi:hypothetical protein